MKKLRRAVNQTPMWDVKNPTMAQKEHIVWYLTTQILC